MTELADSKDDSFEIEMKPLRRPAMDENQLQMDIEGKEEKPAEEKKEPAEDIPTLKPLTHSGDKNVENEKKKAQKRVRSMFDLITFDNV